MERGPVVVARIDVSGDDERTMATDAAVFTQFGADSWSCTALTLVPTLRPNPARVTGTVVEPESAVVGENEVTLGASK